MHMLRSHNIQFIKVRSERDVAVGDLMAQYRPSRHKAESYLLPSILLLYGPFLREDPRLRIHYANEETLHTNPSFVSLSSHHSEPHSNAIQNA